MVTRATLKGINGLLERTRAQATERLRMSQLATLPFRLTGKDKQTAKDLAIQVSKGIANGEIDPILVAHQSLTELEAAAKSIESLEQRLQTAQQELATAPQTNQEVISLRSQLEAKTQELAELNTQVQQLEAQLKQVRDGANQLEAARSQLDITNRELQDTLSEKTGELTQAKAALVNANQDLERARAAHVPLPATATQIVALTGKMDAAYSNGTSALNTNVGRIREKNEDSAGYAELPDGRRVYIVADGMGGHGGGDVASRLIVHEFIEALRAGLSPLEALNTASYRVVEQGFEEVREELIQGLLDRGIAHDLVNQITSHGLSLVHIMTNHQEIAQAHGLDAARVVNFVNTLVSVATSKNLLGPKAFGTTLVAAIVDEANQTLQLAHVGDSRILAVTPSEADLLTLDHSYNFDLYRLAKGEIPFPLSENAIATVDSWKHPDKALREFSSVITSCIGGTNFKAAGQPILQPPTHVNVLEIPLLPSSELTKLLLHSDGATDNVPQLDLIAIARSSDNVAQIARQIIERAFPASNDNITVAAVNLPYKLDLANLKQIWPVPEPSIEVNVEPAPTPTPTPAPVKTFEQIVTSPLRNRLHSLSDQSIDQALRQRLLTEHLIPLCDTQHQTVNDHLSDPNTSVKEAAKIVMRNWVMVRLDRLASQDVNSAYYGEMVRFLLDNHSTELREIIEGSLGDRSIQDMARTIWQTSLQPAPAPTPEAPSLRQLLREPLERQLSNLNAPLAEDVRSGLIAHIWKNNLPEIIAVRKKTKNAQVKADVDQFLSAALVQAMNAALQSEPIHQALITQVRNLKLQDLVLNISRDQQTDLGIRRLAEDVYDKSRRFWQPKRS